MKTIATVFLVLDVIGSIIVMANVGFLYGLCVLVIAVTQLIPWYALDSILENQAAMRNDMETTRRLIEKMNRNQQPTENVVHSTSSSRPNISKIANDKGDGTWYCSDCGTTNASNSRTCKGCGKDK